MVEGGGHGFVTVGGGDADVIYQGVEPDVGDVIFIEGNRDAPVQTRRWAADAQIFEGVIFEKAKDFVATMGGLNEGGVGFDVIDQPLLMSGELEEIIFFFEHDDFAVGGGEGSVFQA